MELLKNKIIAQGIAINEKVLKVDSFLNHQVDVPLMQEVGLEFAKYFRDQGITRVMTIESSGICPAAFTALALGVPLVIMKKQLSCIHCEELLSTPVHSFTKNKDYTLTLSPNYIQYGDRVLIIDDFLANGEAALGACRLVEAAKATVSGIGIVIEKSFQPGRTLLQEKGYQLYSLARISKLGHGVIEFA